MDYALIESTDMLLREATYDLENRLVEFAVRVIAVVDALPDTRAGKHIASQLVRSGTSPAPN